MNTSAASLRDSALDILHYRAARPLPLVHFGFWGETLHRWADQGHITPELARSWGDSNAADREISRLLGFDFNWSPVCGTNAGLQPGFNVERVREFPDGSYHERNGNGVVLLKAPGNISIPAEIDHTLKDRASWEAEFKPRLVWDQSRFESIRVNTPEGGKRMAEGGLEYLRAGEFDRPAGAMVGSLIGWIRDWIGFENLSYLSADDPELLEEMVETIAELQRVALERLLEAGAKLDFIHFWEDICFRSGPLVTEDLFANVVAPRYRKLTELARRHGITLASVDCDGCIDVLVPHWLQAGVNIMFPIEVGVWGANIAPWREKYGRELRGVGGVDKKVFAINRAAVDAEVERLRPLVDLGGYIPCPDHRLPPETEWDLVRYYCDRMRQVFGG